MSNVWKAYEQIMADKIVKTAEKKADTDYDVKVPAAGPDTPVEETGYDLVEIAHPEQIQVSNSQLNDGIVENGVERQKVMIDVALRNPRGVIAELIDVLVKAANVLDDEGEYKMAAEVDVFMEKLGQAQAEQPIPATARIPHIIEAAKEALNRLDKLDWGTTFVGPGTAAKTPYIKQAEKVIGIIMARLRDYLAEVNEVPAKATNDLMAYMNYTYDQVVPAIQLSTDWGSDQENALEAWRVLKRETDKLAPIVTETRTTGIHTVEPGSEEAQQLQQQVAPSTTHGRPAPGAMTSRRPSTSGQGTHNYSVGGPSDPTGDKLVRELQGLLGLSGKSLDGKFGPETFAAVQQEASHDAELGYYLNGYPGLKAGYHGWSPTAVQYAINAIKSYRGKPGQAQPQTSDYTERLDKYNPARSMEEIRPSVLPKATVPKITPPPILYTKQPEG